MPEQYTERFFKAPSNSFFVFGPRGTGKSTWLKKNFPDAYQVDLLDDEPDKTLAAYVTLYLKEEVKEEGLEESSIKVDQNNMFLGKKHWLGMAVTVQYVVFKSQSF